jgi:hypothetical protein
MVKGGKSGGNSWNAHQSAMGGQGYSRAEIRSGYSSYSQPAPTSGTASGNSWNAHQASMAGKGYTKEEIHSSYVSNGTSSSIPVSLPTPMNWNEFRTSVKDKGLSGEEISKQFTAYKSSNRSSGVQVLNWNEFRTSVKDKGLSREEISKQFTASKSSNSSSGVQVLNWNEFRTSVKDKGLSGPELSEQYAASKSSNSNSGEKNAANKSDNASAGNPVMNWNEFKSSNINTKFNTKKEPDSFKKPVRPPKVSSNSKKDDSKSGKTAEINTDKIHSEKEKPNPSKSKDNAWNEFRTSVKGQGLSKAEITFLKDIKMFVSGSRMHRLKAILFF